MTVTPKQAQLDRESSLDPQSVQLAPKVHALDGGDQREYSHWYKAKLLGHGTDERRTLTALCKPWVCQSHADPWEGHAVHLGTLCCLTAYLIAQKLP